MSANMNAKEAIVTLSRLVDDLEGERATWTVGDGSCRAALAVLSALVEENDLCCRMRDDFRWQVGNLNKYVEEIRSENAALKAEVGQLTKERDAWAKSAYDLSVELAKMKGDKK